MATSAKFKVSWWGQDPYEGAEPDALVIAAALAWWWAERSFNVSAKLGYLVIHRTAKP